ncbi:MAG: PQQ-binding-like beta-propeller repeat protein [Pirellula sp.]
MIPSDDLSQSSRSQNHIVFRDQWNRRQSLVGLMGAGLYASLPAQDLLSAGLEPKAMEANGSNVPAADGWWTWRGPNGNNIAAPGSTAPTKYMPDHVVWESPVPGRGHSSPIVAGENVYLTTADKSKGTQSVLAFSRTDGSTRWAQIAYQGGIPAENHQQNTEASPTMAFDGERLFASFYNSTAIWLNSLTTDGKILWQKSVGKYDPQRFKYGYAASPTLYKDTIIVVADYDGDAFLAALDRKTGKQVWRTKRAASVSFSSPIVAKVAGRDQLLISGNESIVSYDPNGGKELWTAKCLTMATCGTLVWDDAYVYASGGFPKAETVCVQADGSGKVVWKNGQKCYEQSMLLYEGFVYAVTDPGIAYCWRATDGNAMWRQRLGGKFSCSPVLVGDVIHVFNEQGQGFTFRAKPSEYESIGGGKIADEVFATPAVVGDTMYMRLARNVSGKRQEYLVALR